MSHRDETIKCLSNVASTRSGVEAANAGMNLKSSRIASTTVRKAIVLQTSLMRPLTKSKIACALQRYVD